MEKKCIALYSGGLDSILAVKIMQEQGFEVAAISFCTPFFGHDLLTDTSRCLEFHERAYGIRVQPYDFTREIIEVVASPRHGFGKHLNPCIDCKIRMLATARGMLKDLGASFVVTGEVLGQRPMSQRRDTMNIIEKESGLKDILLRPLCAQHLPPTLPERTGLVNREQLLDLAGRGRKKQMDLAESFGIDPGDIPSPAGGCLLTDEQISRKVRSTYERLKPDLPTRADIMLDIAGRRFTLDKDKVIVESREENENRVISYMTFPGNVFLKIADVPGPVCIVRGRVTPENLENAAAICLRYGKGRGTGGHRAVYGPEPSRMTGTLEAPVVPDDFCRRFQIDWAK